MTESYTNIPEILVKALRVKHPKWMAITEKIFLHRYLNVHNRTYILDKLTWVAVPIRGEIEKKTRMALGSNAERVI